MMATKLIDFTNCENGYRKYEGSDGKRSIKYDNDYYLLKLPSKKEAINELQTSHVNNVLSEYVSSKIIKEIGVPVHDVLIGTYNGEIAVACKDFTGDGYELQEFSWFMKNLYRREDIGRTVRYDQLYDVFEKSDVLKEIKEEAVVSYWNMFVCDALIGNFDRHKDNWGYLVNKTTREVKPSPIYDNGSSLYPELSEDGMVKIINNQEEIDKRLFEFPKAALNKNDNNKKVNKFGYYEMLSGNIDKNCEAALLRIYPKINMENIKAMINNMDILSETRKLFYNTMLEERYQKILTRSYEKVYERWRIDEMDKWEKGFLDKAEIKVDDRIEREYSFSERTRDDDR